MPQPTDSPTTPQPLVGRLSGPAAGPLELTVAAASFGARGAGAAMSFGVIPSPFGLVLLALTGRGICWLGIHESASYLEAELRADCPRAAIVRDDRRAAPLGAQAIAALVGDAATLDLPMDIRATPFQLAVWRELCAIPRGATSTYGAIARRLGNPAASRAVGRANGSNPTALIIPCHRAIGADGSLTGYRWGVAYKRRLLEHEAALAPGASAPLQLALPG